MARKQQEDDKSLETIFPTPRIVETSIGEIEVKEYRLKQISQVLPYIAEIAQSLNIGVNGGKVEIKDFNISYVLYVMAANDSQCLMRLCSLSTDKSEDDLGELTASESASLFKAVFEVAVMPMFSQLGKGFGVDLTPGKKAPAGQTT